MDISAAVDRVGRVAVAYPSTLGMCRTNRRHAYHSDVFNDFAEVREDAARPVYRCVACAGRMIEVYEGEEGARRLVRRRNEGNHNPAKCNRLRMAYLAETFHGLRGAPGVLPWDPQKLARWVRSGARGHGSQCAGRFVLMVWNRDAFDKPGLRFDVGEAFACWDDSHRGAFLAWAQRHWWP
jgi:hypothetical protein